MQHETHPSSDTRETRENTTPSTNTRRDTLRTQILEQSSFTKNDLPSSQGSQQLDTSYRAQYEIGGSKSSEFSKVDFGDRNGNILAIGFKESREFEIEEVMQDYERDLHDPRIAGRAFMAEELNPHEKGNCHGFSLTGRRDVTIDESSFSSVESAHIHPVQAVMNHFQFKPVAHEQSEAHDLVVYYNDTNEIIHSGRVFIDKETQKPMVGSLPGEAPFTHHEFDAVFKDYTCSNGEPKFVVWRTDDPSKGYITATSLAVDSSANPIGVKE